jgi:hypothetical protein
MIMLPVVSFMTPIMNSVPSVNNTVTIPHLADSLIPPASARNQLWIYVDVTASPRRIMAWSQPLVGGIGNTQQHPPAGGVTSGGGQRATPTVFGRTTGPVFGI